MCECTPELQKLCSKNSIGVNWCPMCVYETSNRKDLEEHIKSLHQSNYSSFSASPGNMKYCPDCKYGTAQRSRLMNHRRTVHNRQTFDCPSCGFETTKIYKLKNHIDSVHEGDTVTRMRSGLLSMEEIKEETERKKGRDQKSLQVKHKFSHISVEEILIEEKQLQQKLTLNPNSVEDRRKNKKIEKKIKYRQAMVEILNGNAESLRKTASKFKIRRETLVGMLEEREVQNYTNSEEIFPCLKCDFTTSNTNLIIEHIKLMHRKDTFAQKCHFCDYQNVPFHVKNHIKIMHEKEETERLVKMTQEKEKNERLVKKMKERMEISNLATKQEKEQRKIERAKRRSEQLDLLANSIEKRIKDRVETKEHFDSNVKPPEFIKFGKKLYMVPTGSKHSVVYEEGDRNINHEGKQIITEPTASTRECADWKPTKKSREKIKQGKIKRIRKTVLLQRNAETQQETMENSNDHEDIDDPLAMETKEVEAVRVGDEKIESESPKNEIPGDKNFILEGHILEYFGSDFTVQDREKKSKQEIKSERALSKEQAKIQEILFTAVHRVTG